MSTNLPAAVEVIEPTMMDLRADLPVATTGDVDQTVLLVAYKAGYNRAWKAAFEKGRKLGMLVSGSEDASYKEGYDTCYEDLRKLGRLK